jgi:hypothetical protein
MFEEDCMKGLLRFALALLLCACTAAQAQERQTPSPTSTMAPVSRYLLPSVSDEIAMARTAAPPSVSDHADIYVLGKQGYYLAVKGNNGFACFVARSWTAPFTDPGFWNPKTQGPECMNPPAARSVLPQYLARTQWVLAGATLQQLIEKAKAAYASHRFGNPVPNSFAFMLSKEGYLGDQAGGPWLPHVMPFIATDQLSTWAAGLPGSPIIGDAGSPYEPVTIFIPVRRWSDGSPGPLPSPLPDQHKM